MGIIDPKSENRKNLLVFVIIMVIGIGIFTAYIIWGTLPLDKILDYEVVVYPQEDGSLEITYSYRWKVLNDSREGPLTWVSLGIPNSACRLMSYKGAIAGLHSSYYADGLIDFDLDRAYQKGEIAEFSFKIHQGRMLCRNTLILRRDGLDRSMWSIIGSYGKEALISGKPMRTEKK